MTQPHSSWYANIETAGADLEYGRDTQLVKLDRPPFYANLNVSAEGVGESRVRERKHCEAAWGSDHSAVLRPMSRSCPI